MLIVRGVPRDEVGPLERMRVDRIGARRREQRAAGGIAPRADQRRQAGDRAHGVAAAGDALHAVVDADRGGLGRAVVARERHDLRRPRCRRSRPRAPASIRCARARQRVEARPCSDRRSRGRRGPSRDQHVHDAERERGVGAGHQRDVLVAFLGGRAAIGIDRDELRAAPLGFLRARPEVQVRRDRVAAPDQDQPAVLVLLDVHPDRRADHRGPAGLAGGRADRAVEQRRAEPVEEAPVHRRVLQEAHRARVAVRAGSPAGRRSTPRSRRSASAIVSSASSQRDAREPALALAADAPHRMQHALVGVRAVEIARDLRAQHALRRRMVGRAADRDRAAVLDGRQHRAGVRTIVRAGAADDAAAGGGGGSSGMRHANSTGLCTARAALITLTLTIRACRRVDSRRRHDACRALGLGTWRMGERARERARARSRRCARASTSA